MRKKRVKVTLTIVKLANDVQPVTNRKKTLELVKTV